jgi:hypothetical protein
MNADGPKTTLSAKDTEVTTEEHYKYRTAKHAERNKNQGQANHKR